MRVRDALDTMKILISGASGLTGTALVSGLRVQGHNVARLVRPGSAASAGDVTWDPMTATVDVAAMEGMDAVVHLSGASIAQGRWTPARKAVLRSSRVDTTRVLVDALASLRQKPRVFVSASAIGCYGDRGNEILTESSTIGTDFLSLVVRDWEAEANRAEISGIRTVLLRFGVILSSDGGALPQMLMPFKFSLGGRLGSGKQWMSWIALEDAIEIICSAIVNENLAGPLNVVAPNPLTNADFTRIAAAVLHRPAIFAAPAFALRIALGEMADALLLASQRVVPERLLAAGYAFRLPEFESALRSILSPKN
jgi:uncharacterized protein (TIGR01777 family)